MDIYFAPWIIIQPCLIYSIAHVVPVLATGSSFARLLCFLFLHPSFCCCQHFITFWHYKILQLICTLSVPSPRISPFSKEAWFLLLHNGISYQDLSTGYACCSWGVDISVFAVNRA